MSDPSRFRKLIIAACAIAGVVLTMAPAQASTAPAVAAAPRPVAQDFPPGTDTSNLPRLVGWGSGAATVPVFTQTGTALDGKEIAQVKNGTDDSCVIAEGSLSCRGTVGTFYGNSGDMTGKFVTAVGVGFVHSCAVASGKAYCWGQNYWGQLGHQITDEFEVADHPVAVYDGDALSGKIVTDIAVGFDSTCAIADGKIYCWGYLPTIHGTFHNVERPVAFDPNGILKNKVITSLTSGMGHYCVTADGAAYCWGSNDHGQLGVGSQVGWSRLPLLVHMGGVLNGLTIKTISAGDLSTCVTAGKGSVSRAYCWGSNDYNETGTNSPYKTIHLPRAVATPGDLSTKNVTGVSIKEEGGCLLAEQKAYCWGRNLGGKLGNGTTTASPVPVPASTNGVLQSRIVLSLSSGTVSTSSVAITKPVFGDIAPTNATYDDAAWSVGSGIVRSVGGQFAPSTKVSRLDGAIFLYRFKHPGEPVPPCFGNIRKFTDVAKNDSGCGAIEWLVNDDIIAGGGKFHSRDPLLRQDFATWMFRAHHPNVDNQVCAGRHRIFTDVPKQNPSCGNIEWLSKTGFSASVGTFQPTAAVTRISLATFLHRLDSVDRH
ncbi:hypothetical protein D1871_08300 [Nakamurella silvestris]|nr:hypothetical protein D1871_08300 [Nakamurella silvestris]